MDSGGVSDLSRTVDRNEDEESWDKRARNIRGRDDGNHYMAKWNKKSTSEEHLTNNSMVS